MKILIVFTSGILLTQLSGGGILQLAVDEINFSGSLKDEIKGEFCKHFPVEGEIKLTNLYKLQGVITGCSNEDESKFFKEGPIPTAVEISYCRDLTELEKCLGLMVPNRFLSTTWNFGEEIHDVKFWNICSFSKVGIPLRVLVVKAHVKKMPASETWSIESLNMSVASLTSGE